MREIYEIQKDYFSGISTYGETDTSKAFSKALLEVLLDIRDLLDKK